MQEQLMWLKGTLTVQNKSSLILGTNNSICVSINDQDTKLSANEMYCRSPNLLYTCAKVMVNQGWCANNAPFVKCRLVNYILLVTCLTEHCIPINNAGR